MKRGWLGAIIVLVGSCSLEEYNPAVSVLRDGGGGDSSTTGDGSPGDSPGDPGGGDPGGGDPGGGDPGGGDPGGDPGGGDPGAGDPGGGDPVLPPQATQLNAEAAEPDGDVVLFELTPDGSKVVYLADHDADTKFELYVVNIDGSSQTRLNSTLPNTGDVVEFKISPDGTRVAYRADGRTNDLFELHGVNIDGSNQVKLHGDIADIAIIQKFEISSDNRVMFRADFTTNNQMELYSNNFDGDDFRTISNTITPAAGDVHKFLLSPDHSLVVYQADELTDTREELHAVNPDGSNNQLVHEPYSGDGWKDSYETFVISPDNTTVAFLGARTTSGVTEVYASVLGSGTSVRVNPDMVTDGTPSRELWFTPDSSHIVYRASQDVADRFELYSVHPNGGGRAKLHPDLPDGRATGTVRMLPDSSRILHTDDIATEGAFELYAVNPDGSGRAKLNSDFSPGQNIVRFAAAPDSSRVIYLANENDVNTLDLYSIRPNGNNRARLTDFGAGGNVYNFRITPDSARVVFTADGDFDGVIELYAVGLDGSNLVRLNDALGGGAQVADFRASSSHVVYLADPDTIGLRELFAKAGLTTMGGGISTADATTTLDDTGLVARYYLDEAATGRAPTEILDAASNPLSIAITWSPNMSYIAGPGGRGLQWQRVDSPGTATRSIDSTKMQSRLEGSTTGTLETVVDIDHDTESEPRVIYFGTGSSHRGFCLLLDGPKKRVKFWLDYEVNNDALWWGLDFIDAGRHVLTVVMDTDQGAPLDRVRLFVDGVHLPGFHEAPGTITALGATLSLSSDHDNDIKTPDRVWDFYIGNRTGGERSNDGRIYYVSVYDEPLTDAQVYQNATILLHDDDTP